ncbi:MAG: hypothetical protein JXA41_07700 [Deltaproteobacteria bacterium]|nr:hypothetical protein [Deltaproteobacteria bacterium]
MTDNEVYNDLEKAFVDTFLGELLPGIFHNFANPLNGIMGRSKLMQRRLAEFVKKLEGRYPDIEQELGTDYNKLLSDINAINNESERFFDMFQFSTAKFYTIGSRAVEKLSLSNVIEQEIKFADFYLDFKHNIKKEIHLDHDIPFVSGIAAFYSMALWMLMRYAMSQIRKSYDKTFFMKTDYDDQFVCADIAMPLDEGLFQIWQENASQMQQDLHNVPDIDIEQKKLFFAMSLLQKASKGVLIMHDGDGEKLTIKIPYR